MFVDVTFSDFSYLRHGEKWEYRGGGQIDKVTKCMYNMYMPTLVTFGSYQLSIKLNDHDPPHVHAYGNGCTAKLKIEDGEVIAVKGFTRKDIKKIQELIERNKEHLMDKWSEYHEEN